MSMTPTREQLELAAKAAGITADKSATNGGGEGNTGFDMLGNLVIDWHNNKVWNPVTSKSDSFDLMVALLERNLEIISNDKEVCVHCFYECRGSALLEDYNNDKGLATCAAMFLCAVEIGRSL